MHPEILRELTSQRGREMRDQAHQATLARMAIKIRRARRRGLSGLEDGAEIVLPPIPDYVDGSFRATSAHDQAAGQPGPLPATGRAA
jgi:hypothetical protein